MPRGWISTDLPGQGRCRIPVTSALLVGRGEDCDLVVEDRAASRHHLQIRLDGDAFVWRDLKSLNGTRHNGAPSTGGRLAGGDRLTIGDIVLTFEVENEAPAPSKVITGLVFGPTGGPSSGGKAEELLRAVYTVMNEIASTYEPCPLVDKILETTMKAVRAKRGAVFFGGPQRGDLAPCPDCGRLHMIVDGTLCRADCGEIQVSRTIARQVLEGGESVLYRESDEVPSAKVSESMQVLHLRSIICVPVRGKYRILGVLYMDTDRRDQQYTREDLLLSSAVGNSAGLALENVTMHLEILEKQRMEQEIQVAAAIQSGFLVTDWDSGDPRLEVFGGTVPARTVGGDFYDFVRADGDRAVLTIGDVSGKGVPASLAMAQIIAEFRLRARDLRSPAKIVAELNETMVKRSTRGMFATLCCATIDVGAGTVRWANAGHPPPLRLGAGEASYVGDPVGVPIGVLSGATWEEGALKLAPGESLVLYTDGVIEARTGHTWVPGTDGSWEYGFERLRAKAGGLPGRPPQAIVDAVFDDVRQFASPDDPHDDVTMMAVRFRG